MAISKIPPHKVTRTRPNPARHWVCGYQKTGFECEDGPSQNGVCCLKASKDTEGVRQELSSHCAATCGGSASCELAEICNRKRETLQDLGPCIPRRANWFARQNFALNLAILIGGILLLFMALPQREVAFKPGDLSRKHSQILGNTLISDRCSLCHPNSHPEDASKVTQDELCMQCHTNHMPDAINGNPHDLKQEFLTSLSENTPLAKTRFISIENALGLQTNKIEKTKCAMCHVEHHGKSRDLKSISNTSCQTCHKNQFNSFASGHPQFDGYPYRTERRIAFDHAAHMTKYFAQKNQEFSCNGCHLQGASGAGDPVVWRGVGFEEACASCHLESIKSATVSGWTIFQTPCLDPEVIQKSGNQFSDWPQNAVFDNEGKISIALRLLLAADPSQTEALRTLGGATDLNEVAPDRRSQISATIAKGYRTLIQEIASNGQNAVERRLRTVGERALERELNRHELQLIQRMTAGLPPDLFRQISQQWFIPRDGVAAEFPKARGAKLSLVSTQKLADDEELLVDDSNDPLLAEFGFTEAFPDPRLRSKAESSSRGENSFTLNQNARGEQDAGDLLSEDEANSLLESGINGDESSEDDFGSATDLASDEDLLSGSATLGENDDSLLNGPESGTEDRASPPQKFVMTKLRGSDHVGAGGWYLDPTLLAVKYMPMGHEDSLVAAWLEFAEILLTKSSEPERRLAWYSKGIARHNLIPGGCNDCHVVGTNSSPTELWGNWQSVTQPRDVKLFTKFDHTPHLTLATLEDCIHCHRMGDASPGALASVLKDTRQKSVVASTSWNATKARVHECLSSEFQAMELDQCSACHRQGAANDSCTQCHNYHIGNASYLWSNLRGSYDGPPLESSKIQEQLIR